MLDSSRFSPLWPYAVAAPVALFCSLSALIVLWIRRRSVLDLWLMVVMCLYSDRATSKLLPGSGPL